ncbi:MAG: hypothetical protein HRT99_03480 [Mycoplasmatales bacterium]|nr:hypothetical protein [Mycoplasmatales bacterium]
MKFITINYSLNKTFFVEDDALKKMILKASENSNKSKIIDCEIIVHDNYSYLVELVIKIKKGLSYKESLLELTSEIEKYSHNLIDSKPTNIQILIKGEF